MAWRPSLSKGIPQRRAPAFWTALETVYDNAVPTTPLDAKDPTALEYNYSVARRARRQQDADTLSARLAVEYKAFDLGPPEIELIDFLNNYPSPKSLVI